MKCEHDSNTKAKHFVTKTESCCCVVFFYPYKWIDFGIDFRYRYERTRACVEYKVLGASAGHV
jgi:hypothetical protein